MVKIKVFNTLHVQCFHQLFFFLYIFNKRLKIFLMLCVPWYKAGWCLCKSHPEPCLKLCNGGQSTLLTLYTPSTLIQYLTSLQSDLDDNCTVPGPKCDLASPGLTSCRGKKNLFSVCFLHPWAMFFRQDGDKLKAQVCNHSRTFVSTDSALSEWQSNTGFGGGFWCP